MLCIGVFGEERTEITAKIISELYTLCGYETFVVDKRFGSLSLCGSIKRTGAAEKSVLVVFTDSINYMSEGIKFDLAVVSCSAYKGCLPIVRHNGTIVLNMDTMPVDAMEMPMQAHDRNVITCGFNSMAAVTASSVLQDDIDGETISICLRHSIKNLNGKKIEPQEFSVHTATEGYRVGEVLAGVTAAVAGNVKYTMLVSPQGVNIF